MPLYLLCHLCNQASQDACSNGKAGTRPLHASYSIRSHCRGRLRSRQRRQIDDLLLVFTNLCHTYSKHPWTLQKMVAVAVTPWLCTSFTVLMGLETPL